MKMRPSAVPVLISGTLPAVLGRECCSDSEKSARSSSTNASLHCLPDADAVTRCMASFESRAEEQRFLSLRPHSLSRFRVSTHQTARMVNELRGRGDGNPPLIHTVSKTSAVAIETTSLLIGVIHTEDMCILSGAASFVKELPKGGTIKCPTKNSL